MTAHSQSIVSRSARFLCVAAAASVLTLTTAACSNDATSPSKARTVYGPSLSLGLGTARTFVTLDAAGKQVSLGVALTDAALTGLPTTPMPGMPSAAMLSLTLPAEAANMGYDHVMVDWNPQGHEPALVYTLPHFDFHFYQITPAEREAILPTDPQFAAKAARFPSAEFVPAGFVPASTLANTTPDAATVPQMGLHWLATNSPELQPPPANKPFTSTFIYGSYDGRFTFIEPMITKAFIESVKTSADGVTFPLPVPAKVARPGLYPSSYAVRHDSATGEYRITLEGLTAR